MKTYSDNVPKEENTVVRFPSLKYGDGFQKRVASIADDRALGECELHTFQDMKWNDKQQCPIKYRS